MESTLRDTPVPDSATRDPVDAFLRERLRASLYALPCRD